MDVRSFYQLLIALVDQLGTQREKIDGANFIALEAMARVDPNLVPTAIADLKGLIDHYSQSPAPEKES